jgi:hypothetical protein
MAHQSGSDRLINHALEAYAEKAGVSLAQHPLAIKLMSYDTVEDIASLVQDQARGFKDFQGSDQIIKSIQRIVLKLSEISSVASLATFGLVRKKKLMAYRYISDFIHRHPHLQWRYKFVSLSYLTYVPYASSYVDGLVTPEGLSRPRV